MEELLDLVIIVSRDLIYHLDHLAVTLQNLELEPYLQIYQDRSSFLSLDVLRDQNLILLRLSKLMTTQLRQLKQL